MSKAIASPCPGIKFYTWVSIVIPHSCLPFGTIAPANRERERSVCGCTDCIEQREGKTCFLKFTNVLLAKAIRMHDSNNEPEFKVLRETCYFISLSIIRVHYEEKLSKVD